MTTYNVIEEVAQSAVSSDSRVFRPDNEDRSGRYAF
jgi:hypothetical protein